MAKYGLTPQGPNPKRLDVILEDMHSKMTDRLGVNTRQNPQSLLNHILTNVADEIAELWEFGVDVYHSQYTSSATGVSLDYAAQFGGSTREMAAKSYYSILCTGLDGTTIPAGTVIASDTNPATSLTTTVALHPIPAWMSADSRCASSSARGWASPLTTNARRG